MPAEGLVDPCGQVRTAVSTAVAAIAEWDWPEQWPELVPALIGAVQTKSSADAVQVHGALPAMPPFSVPPRSHASPMLLHLCSLMPAECLPVAQGALRCLSIVAQDLDDMHLPHLLAALLPEMAAIAANRGVYGGDMCRRALQVAGHMLRALGHMSGREQRQARCAAGRRQLPRWMAPPVARFCFSILSCPLSLPVCPSTASLFLYLSPSPSPSAPPFLHATPFSSHPRDDATPHVAVLLGAVVGLLQAPLDSSADGDGFATRMEALRVAVAVVPLFASKAPASEAMPHLMGACRDLFLRVCPIYEAELVKGDGEGGELVERGRRWGGGEQDKGP